MSGYARSSGLVRVLAKAERSPPVGVESQMKLSLPEKLMCCQYLLLAWTTALSEGG